MTRGGALLAGVWLLLAAAQGVRVWATGHLMSGDAVFTLVHLHSLVVDRDLDPRNEIRHFQQVRSPRTGLAKIASDRVTRDPKTGEPVNKVPLGVAILLAPAYILAYAASLGLAGLGLPAEVSGYGWTYQYACGLMTAAWGILGLWFCQRAAAGAGASRADRWWATLLIAGATPWLFYATLEPLFTHALSATVAAALFWYWLRVRGTLAPRDWAVAGVVAGVATLVRYQDAVILLVPAVDLLRRLPSAPRPAAACLAALGAGMLAALTPQLAANAALYGSPLETGYFGEGFVYWRDPKIGVSLVSRDVGLLRWSPIAALAIVGLVLGWRRGWPQARAGLLLLALQIYVVSSWYFFTQGHSFGNRMLVQSTVVLVVGLTALLAALGPHPRARRAVKAAGLGLVGVNLAAMALWSFGVIGPLSRASMP